GPAPIISAVRRSLPGEPPAWPGPLATANVLEPVCISRKPPRSPSGGIKPHRPAAITGKILGVSILEEALSVITRPGKNLLLVYSYALHSQSPGALRLLAKRAPLSPRLRNGSPASARIRRLCRCVRPCGS